MRFSWLYKILRKIIKEIDEKWTSAFFKWNLVNLNSFSGNDFLAPAFYAILIRTLKVLSKRSQLVSDEWCRVVVSATPHNMWTLSFLWRYIINKFFYVREKPGVFILKSLLHVIERCLSARETHGFLNSLRGEMKVRIFAPIVILFSFDRRSIFVP